MISIVSVGFAQTNSFDVFTYQPPEFFTKSELPAMVQFNLTNNDCSFCTITLYKDLPAQNDVIKDVPYEGENIPSYQVVVQKISDLYIVYTNLTEALPGKIDDTKQNTCCS